jgi:hypothetical protein
MVFFLEQLKNARPDLTVLKEYKQRKQEFFNRAKLKNARPDLTVLKEYKQHKQEFFNRAKDEPRTKPQARKAVQERTPSTELLHIYTIPELIKFKKPDLTVLKEYKQHKQEFFNRAKDEPGTKLFLSQLHMWFFF